MPAGSTSTSLSITNPLVLYRALVATNRIKADPAQHRLALQLQKLYYRLKDYDPELEYRHRLEQISRRVDESSSTIKATTQPHQRQGEEGEDVSKQGRFSSFWRRGGSSSSRSSGGGILALTRTVQVQESALRIQSPRGMLLYGEVGRGKSMLLDLLYDSLPSRKKRRWHFNTFMLDVFRRLEVGRIERMSGGGGGSRGTIPIEPEHSVLTLAKETISQSPILFLDEFQLPDRTSSKLLNGFMTSFFHLGGVLVASSNRMPEELAKAAGVEFAPRMADTMGSLFGWYLRRSEGERAAQSDFGQFLEVLKARCEVWEMEGERDWRREYDDDGSGGRSQVGAGDGFDGEEISSDDALSTTSTSPTSISETSADPSSSSDTPLYYHIAFPPTSPDATSSTESWTSALLSLNPTQTWIPANITVYGRHVPLPSTSPTGICFSTFSSLCASNLGPADYISLASTFHTLILTDIPVLTLLHKNEARRFITLLDALYEARCRLLIRAAAPPDGLFFPETNKWSGRGDRGNEQQKAKKKYPHEAQSSSSSSSEGPGDSESVHQETFAEIYQDSSNPFRPNISSYSPTGDSSAAPTRSLFNPSLRSVLADEDSDFGPTYGNGRGAGPSSGEAGLEETLRRQGVGVDAAGPIGPDFTNIARLTGEDERFAYKRARSRLWEMCGTRWWGERADSAPQEWWRPVHREGRTWEGDTIIITSSAAAPPPPRTGRNRSEATPPPPRNSEGKGSHDGTYRPLPIHGENHARENGTPLSPTHDDDENNSSSPFRTSPDPPPRLTERHVWGMGLWGRKAGAWGRGEVKVKEKEDGDGKK